MKRILNTNAAVFVLHAAQVTTKNVTADQQNIKRVATVTMQT